VVFDNRWKAKDWTEGFIRWQRCNGNDAYSKVAWGIHLYVLLPIYERDVIQYIDYVLDEDNVEVQQMAKPSKILQLLAW